MMNAEKSFDYAGKVVNKELFLLLWNGGQSDPRQLITTADLEARFELNSPILRWCDSIRLNSVPVVNQDRGWTRCHSVRSNVSTPKQMEAQLACLRCFNPVPPKRPTVDKFKNRFSSKMKKVSIIDVL